MYDEKNDGEQPYKVGRGKPPLPSRFQKGVSGNRVGRPKGSKKLIPYDAVLSREVSVFEAEGERKVEAAEAFLLYIRQRWAAGDPTARKIMGKAMEARKQLRSYVAPDAVRMITIGCVAAGSPNGAFLPLKMGVKQDSFRLTARILIEPWLVQAAIDRLGDRRFTRDEQAVIVKTTRTPHKVKWPDWWEVKPGTV